jgi:DNA-directed RNA polymerase specialized sigma24 family protein
MAETFARALVQSRRRWPQAPLPWLFAIARAVDDEPYELMAARLHCSEAVVRKRVSRALAQARETVGEADA